MAPNRRSSLFADDDHHHNDLLAASSSSSSSSSSGLSLTNNHEDSRNSRRRSSLTEDDENNGSSKEMWHDELVALTNSNANMTVGAVSERLQREEDPLLLEDEVAAASDASVLPFQHDENTLFSTSAAAEAEACKHDAAIAAMLAAETGTVGFRGSLAPLSTRRVSNNQPKERTTNQHLMDAIGMVAVMMGWLILGILMFSHWRDDDKDDDAS